MRNYLYKAKRKNWKELPKEKWWVRGYLWVGIDFSCITPDNIGISYYEESKRVTACSYEVDPDTICQYTGLTNVGSKDIRKIFEGDIFQASDGEFMQRYVITWDESYLGWSAQCVGNPDGTLPLSEFRAGEIEVIGNIYDNLELAG